MKQRLLLGLVVAFSALGSNFAVLADDPNRAQNPNIAVTNAQAPALPPTNQQPPVLDLGLPAPEPEIPSTPSPLRPPPLPLMPPTVIKQLLPQPVFNQRQPQTAPVPPPPVPQTVPQPVPQPTPNPVVQTPATPPVTIPQPVPQPVVQPPVTPPPVVQQPPPPPAPTTTPTPYLTPEEELKKFALQPGYSLELVVSDPIIKEPVVAVFDGNGRMFVAEMRSYMQDIDGSNENSKVGRVSMHWSSKGDGVFDKHTVFIDNLNLPRMILPMDGGILVNETDTEDIYLYRDTDGDGVADKKELWHAGGPRGGNLEHQPSGLVWDLDNWIYMAVNGFRLRMQGTNVVSEPTGANLGQWGLSQDDYGKPWFVNAGYEAGPLNFEMPIVYGGYEPPEKFVPNFAEVWPLVTLGDYEGGQARLHPDKSLNHFTGTCGPDIYRGDHLPADLRGDLLFCEPVGRLIRRAKVDVKEAFTSLSNVYDKEHSEFIRSTDPNFRPVNIVTAPDGTIYIVDMYRGIIQEGNWVRPGTYLRGVVQQNELQKNFGRGRIWRLVYNGMKPGSQPHMLDEKPAQLVKHLESPNGWWRDTAQKLLILRANKSVVPALVKMARADSDHLARIHALWTLEGLDALEPEMIRAALKDKHPQVRIAGIRTSETLYKKGDSSLMAEILEMANDPDPNVVLQVLMTGNLLKWPEAQKVASATVTSNPAFGIKKMGVQLVQSAAPPQIPQEVSQQERSLLVRGGEIYQQLCFSCHGLDGKGTPLAGAAAGTTMAPSLAGGKVATGYRDGIINVVLKGLSGPLDGKTYTAQMVPMQSYDDAWIAAVTSFIRNNFGNSSSFVTPQDVARVRSTFAAKTDPWTANELAEVLPKPMADGWRWKISASHNEKSAKLAIDGDPKTRYDTHTAQAPGMWLEIKLPWKTNIAGLELDAGKAANSFPRKYKVELSTDGRNWGKPVATGHGTGKQTEIIFAPTEARYIRITQTGETPDHVWSVGELQVLKPASPWFHSTPTEAKKPSPSAFE